MRNIQQINRIFTRTFSAKAKNSAAFGCADKPDVDTIKHDYIGPPEKESNLRPILRFIPKNESKLEERLRTNRLIVEKWNQEFWTNHNQRFYNEKEEFMAANKTSESDTLSADKMSEFYKAFLDKNWRLHMLYNVSWYMKNLDLLLLAAQVNIVSAFKRRKNE